jgi:tetratricopeptide (TPR) repeat protein
MDGRISNDDSAPVQVSRFRIAERVGAGAMGVVYRARDTLLKRDVALKLVLPEYANDPGTRSRFLRECQAAAAINHPGIATIYEAGETDDGQLYLASELVDGETLKARVARGALPPDEVLDLAIQLAEALAAAHGSGAIHRDIKPGNLMLTPDGRLKVLDFGLARLSALVRPEDEDDETLTQTREGMVVGTPAYMSPEQAAGEEVDARTDIFASGCVIYEMLCGRSPFKSSSVPDTLRRVLVEDPPALESSVSGAPAGLDAVIDRALAKDRERRYQSAREMADELRALRTSEFVQVTLARARGRRRVVGAVLATVGVVAATLIALQLLVWNRPGLAFENRDRVLIADVDNQTGDDAFDLALRTALEADLQQSPYATVVQRSQIRETLQLMRADSFARIDEELGRDLCRFADIRALLLPRILSAGEAYELHAILVDPVTGDHVDRIRVAARGREEVLLESIDRLTRQVRKRLGESSGSIRSSDVPVAKATTSSWDALRYLSFANQKWSEGQYLEAASMLELAIREDPHFAAAKGTLGLLLIQFLDGPQRGRELLQEALADGEGLPQREYLMLRAVNRQFVDGDLEGALDEYELICELYPDNMAATNNRGRILMALERYDEAVAMFERAAELDPRSSVPLFNQWILHVQKLRRPKAAEAVARRALTLGAENPGFRTMLGWSLTIQSRLSEAAAEFRHALAVEPDHQYALPNLALVSFSLGEVDDSEPLFRRVLELTDEGVLPGPRQAAVVDLALVLVAAGRHGEADALVLEESKRMRSGSRGAALTATDYLGLAQLAAAVGRDDEARRWLAQAETFWTETPDELTMAAAAHAMLDEPDEAIRKLRRALEGPIQDPYLPMVLPPFHPLLDDREFLALFGVDEIT